MSIFRYRAWRIGVLLITLVVAVSACSTAVPTSTAGQGPAAPTRTPVTGALATPVPTVSAAARRASSTTGTASTTAPLATPGVSAVPGTPAASGRSAAGTPQAGAQATPGLLPATGSGQASINSVTFTGVEYSFQGPSSIPGGWTRLTFQNKGQEAHDLQLFKLGAGKTISDVVTALASPSAPDWAVAYGGVSADRGQSASFVINLQPGTYVMLSFGQSTQNQIPDAARGMLKDLTVTQPQATAGKPALPTAAVTLDLVDYSFAITGTFQSGKQTVLVSNKGTETHEAVFLRLKQGKTMADFTAAMQAEMSGTPTPPDQLPFEGAPSSSISLAPGVSAYTDVDLQAGEYMVACFIPSTKHGGKPHADLGMLRQITIK